MNRRDRQQSVAAPAASDLTVVKRAGRVTAVQASLALAWCCSSSAGWCSPCTRGRRTARSAPGCSLAETADDAYDPPPDMELALRERRADLHQ